LSFIDQIATTHLRFLGVTGQCTGIIWLKHAAGIEVVAVNHGQGPLEKLADISPSMTWTLPCRKAEASVVRLHAREIGSGTDYVAAVVDPGTRETDIGEFLGALMSDQTEAYEDDSKLGDLVADLRRRFGISFETMIELLGKGAKEVQHKRLMSIVKIELKGYGEAIKICCREEHHVRQVIAVAQAAEGQQFNRVDIEAALHSSDEWLALSAIDSLNHAEDKTYARETLTKSLLDEREPIANRARELLRARK
jgi:hypothetical protein